MTIAISNPKAEYFRKQYISKNGDEGDGSGKKAKTAPRNVRGQKGYYYAHEVSIEEGRIRGGFSYFESASLESVAKFYRAREAYYREQTDQWQLLDVTIFEFQSDYRIANIEKKSELMVQFPESIEHFSQPNFPEKLTIYQLTQVLEEFQTRGLVLEPYFTEYYFRFAKPLVCIFLTFFGVLVGLRGGPRGGSALLRGLSFGSVAILIYYWGISFGVNLGYAGIIPSWIAAFSPNLGFIFLCGLYYLVFMKWKAD